MIASSAEQSNDTIDVANLYGLGVCARIIRLAMYWDTIGLYFIVGMLLDKFTG